jgi:A/G-specific adenine glycosylase
MLQQTQVATVIDYFQRFMQRFPDVRSLAEADEQAVLTMWAGLGYYRRARQLHAAARQIVTDYRAQFPRDVPTLMKLPGIGRYTAGAVASIAFDEPAPIVEANTERLFARLLRLESSPRSPAGSSLLWQFAAWQLPKLQRAKSSNGGRVDFGTFAGGLGPGTINQAAMELGSLICKPVNPQCLICPLVALCPTAQEGLQSKIPVPKPKRDFTPLHHVALVIQQSERWLVRISPPGAWWTGLWDFPRIDVTELGLRGAQSSQLLKNQLSLDEAARSRIASAAAAQLGIHVRIVAPLFSLSHGVTRFRITLDCLQAEAGEAPAGWQWSDRPTLSRLPLTAPAKKIIQRLSEHV